MGVYVKSVHAVSLCWEKAITEIMTCACHHRVVRVSSNTHVIGKLFQLLYLPSEVPKCTLPTNFIRDLRHKFLNTEVIVGSSYCLTYTRTTLAEEQVYPLSFTKPANAVTLFTSFSIKLYSRFLSS